MTDLLRAVLTLPLKVLIHVFNLVNRLEAATGMQLNQGSQTRCPRAVCGPPIYFLRPCQWSYCNYGMRHALDPKKFFILKILCWI
jgi:hypothetical protein